ncbi:hypothetical protein ACFP63_08780 [Oerskovia jenensis]|uniref:Uncharacterized protein n=1 Tax=Oerskovia jenensis TaxID=162169 RepID=A0ABS2LIE3_9CELL|nr:hypothetical protein [Oerskovia jenensis]MBM7480147.1 hypothetical protein [Oerskovia jenensis]
MTAPTSPKPHTPADPTVALPPEIVAAATRAALVARGYDPDVSVRDLPPEDRDLLDVARAVLAAVAAPLWAQGEDAGHENARRTDSTLFISNPYPYTPEES